MRVDGIVRILEHVARKTPLIHFEREDASGPGGSLRGQAGKFVRASRVPIDHVHRQITKGVGVPYNVRR